MHATVSASRPPRTAASMASRRWSDGKRPDPGSASGTGVRLIADHAPCSAWTTQPLRLKYDGGFASASSSRAAQVARRVFGNSVQRESEPVEGPVEHGVTDRQAPQDAGVARLRVDVGEVADLAGGRGELLRIVQEGERERSRTHQRAVAARPPGARVHVERRPLQLGRRGTACDDEST